MDKKIEDIEKQNLENRILILGAHKPNTFFNTHARVYEKVQINMNFSFNNLKDESKSINQATSQINTTFVAQKKSNTLQQQFSSASSNDQGGATTQDTTSKNENSLRKTQTGLISGGGHGKKKTSQASSVMGGAGTPAASRAATKTLHFSSERARSGSR